MMNLLKVSKRTIYRELDNLEVSLKSVNASLKKAARGSFVIEASEEVLEQLKENTDGKSNDLSTAKRQHAILAELLLTTEPLSLAHFMESYRISNTTFMQISNSWKKVFANCLWKSFGTRDTRSKDRKNTAGF